MKFVLAITAVVALLCCCGGAVLAAGQFMTAAGGSPDATCGAGSVLNLDLPLPAIAKLAQDQVRNAAIIIAVGQQKHVPPRGWIIAVATALQESSLHNLGDLGSHNDHDSLGLFQQRPSQGWGTPEQIMNPAYAAGKFYDKLLTIPGWASMPLTKAAQAVQVSAFPDAYAKHELLATLIVAALAPGAAAAAGDAADVRCAAPGEIAASGWTQPVRGGHVGSGFRTNDRPTHQGVDIIVDKGTPIVAASAGIVRTAKCNIDPASWGCDRDGDPKAVTGCGWYVDIDHAGGIMTRYCHMVEPPMVTVGQTVAAGQQIGVSGSSGHSSGPHVHFEVHVNGDASKNGAIDPVPYMKQVGAPL
jgi:hypothetical protein